MSVMMRKTSLTRGLCTRNRVSLASCRSKYGICASATPQYKSMEQTKIANLPITTFPMNFTLWALNELPALADTLDGPSGSPPANSYYVSLGLFLLSLPGLWSLIKRAPKAKIKRKTFEVAGPKTDGAMPLDARAKQIFDYFKNYNYTVKSTGEVITFEGRYQASISMSITRHAHTPRKIYYYFLYLVPLNNPPIPKSSSKSCRSSCCFGFVHSHKLSEHRSRS